LEEILSRRHGGSGGREPRLSEEQCEQLCQKAERGELRTISDGVRWAREEAGVEYTYWGMRHVFDRLDLKKKGPRQQSPKADPEVREAWKKGSEGAPGGGEAPERESLGGQFFGGAVLKGAVPRGAVPRGEVLGRELRGGVFRG
jgi:hypothetical protein